jgi:hypothetical protein
LKGFAAAKKLVVTGTDATELGDMANVVRIRECPGKAYNAAIEKDFEHSSPDSAQEFLASLQGADAVRIQASPQIATSIARTSDGHINVFFANFAGLRGGSNPVQTPQNGVAVTVQAKAEGKGFFLPFLGQAQAVKGERNGDSIRFSLPTISRGAVFWFEP